MSKNIFVNSGRWFPSDPKRLVANMKLYASRTQRGSLNHLLLQMTTLGMPGKVKSFLQKQGTHREDWTRCWELWPYISVNRKQCLSLRARSYLLQRQQPNFNHFKYDSLIRNHDSILPSSYRSVHIFEPYWILLQWWLTLT